MQISEFIKKLQKQPEWVRKTILWSLVIIIGIGLAFWWIKIFSRKMEEFKEEEFIKQINIPDFGEESEGLPKIEIPQIPEEESGELEPETEKLEESGETNKETK